MCWIEIPSRAVCEEVQARIDADPMAALIESKPRSTISRLAVAVAFAAGIVVGWLWTAT